MPCFHVPQTPITKCVLHLTNIECVGLLKAAIRDPDPVVFLENEMLYGQQFPVSDEALDNNFVLPIGEFISFYNLSIDLLPSIK